MSKYLCQSTPPTVRPPQEEAPSAHCSPDLHKGILHCSRTFNTLQIIYLSHIEDQTLQYGAIPSYLETLQRVLHNLAGSLIAKISTS